ncbi:hypothetical protein AVEN_140735-1 [Araneus ventricosus]|uniref:Uncharacterized protein n=1 Tax=Araneus ventricosus TaxID=182803 RepID=A0A4Y2R4J9_ARAVE|nr:hypothetical protein AVEN_140735-1 [Araneus ventricosus]
MTRTILRGSAITVPHHCEDNSLMATSPFYHDLMRSRPMYTINRITSQICDSKPKNVRSEHRGSTHTESHEKPNVVCKATQGLLWDGPRYSLLWSDDENDTSTGTFLTNLLYRIRMRRFDPRIDLVRTRSTYTAYLKWNRGLNSRPVNPEADTVLLGQRSLVCVRQVTKAVTIIPNWLVTQHKSRRKL